MATMEELRVRPAIESRERKDAIWVSAIAILMLMAFLALLRKAELLGQNIPQIDLQRDYALGLLWAAILGCTLWFWPVPKTQRRALLLMWCCKVIVALGFMLYYESFYWALDAYDYFVEATNPSINMSELGWGHGTQNMMMFSWLHKHFLLDSYHALKVSCAFLGLIAVYLIYRAAVRFLGREEIRLFYALALFPSVLFWSSILGKDPLILLGIALHTYGVVGWVRTGKARHMVVAGCGLIVAAMIRAWLAPILAVPLMVLLLLKISGPFKKVVSLVTATAALWLVSSQVLAVFQVEATEDIFAIVDVVGRSWAVGGSAQEIELNLSNPIEAFLFMPLGAFTALFRPLPAEVGNAFGWLAGFENLFLLILLARGMLRVTKQKLGDDVTIWCIGLIMVWSIVYGFISYQNLGAAVRFKLQVLPILLSLLFWLGHKEIPHRSRSPESVH